MSIDVTLTGGAGEYMESATLVSWSARPGEAVTRGQVLAVVETVKAATEIEAPSAGILLEVLVDPGQEVDVGTVLARIGRPEEAGALPVRPSGHDLPPPEPSGDTTQPARTGANPTTGPGDGRIVASPLARRIAALDGVDLARVRGTGPGGRIKSRDVEAAKLGMRARGPDAGGRPTVGLVHGFGANRLTWTALAARLGPYRLITPELPGHGRNAVAAGGSADLVSDIERQLAREAAGTPIHLVGHSLGAAVVAQIAAAGRLPVASLTLIAPAGLGPEIDGAFLAGYLRARTAESLRPWLSRLVANPDALPRALADAVLEERETEGSLTIQTAIADAAFPDGTQAIDIRPLLGPIEVPVKVIWGLRDRIIPASHARGLPGHVAVHMVEAAGHMPQVEDAALVARLVSEAVAAGTTDRVGKGS